MYQGELRSSFGADRLQRFFRDLRDRVVTERLEARQLPANLIEPFRIEQQNVASPEQVSGTIIGGLVPYFIIVLCLSGAMYPAMDLTAGEKERGTIETILSSPVSRVHLVLGKFFMVLTAALLTAVLSMASMGLTLLAGKRLLAGVPQSSDFDFTASISPRALLAVFVMVVPLAVLFSAALLAISLFAKSYREAQSYLSPLTIVVMLPAVVSVLPGVELNAGLSLIPGAEHEFGEQGDRVGHLPLGIYVADFRVVLRLCGDCVVGGDSLFQKRACFSARKSFVLIRFHATLPTPGISPKACARA